MKLRRYLATAIVMSMVIFSATIFPLNKDVEAVEYTEILDEDLGEQTQETIAEATSGGSIVFEPEPDSDGSIILNPTQENQENLFATSGGHVHTDACYDGHRHVPVYGERDLRDVPVVMQYANNTYDNGTYFTSRIDYLCSYCKAKVYSVGYGNFYSGEPNAQMDLINRQYYGLGATDYIQTVTNINLPRLQVYALHEKYMTYIAYVTSNGGNEQNQFRSWDFRITSGFPFWDSNGQDIFIPWNGCHNLAKHPNPNGCFSIGDPTEKFIVDVSCGQDSQGRYLSIRANKASNSEQILSMYISYKSNYQISTVQTGLSIWFKEYGINNTIIQRSNNFILNEFHSNYLTLYFWNERSIQLYNTMETIVNRFPRASQNVGSGWYNFVTPAIDWPFTTIPVISHAGELSQLVWEPFRGDVGTATYGQYYSCRAEHDTTTECNQVVTSITPLEVNQSVYQDENINTDVIVTYLDGTSDTISATTSFSTSTIGDNQEAILSYSGLVGNAKTASNIETRVYVTVMPGLKELDVTPSATTVYNGQVPTFEVKAVYYNGSIKPLISGEYISTGWSDGWGNKALTFSFTEGSRTISKVIDITVLPNVVGLNIIPSETNVLYDTPITFKTKAIYEDGTEREVSSLEILEYNKNKLGTQNVEYSYTENNITVISTCEITVLDYPTDIEVILDSNSIYQTQKIKVTSSLITLASGSEMSNATLEESEYDNITVGDTQIVYSYKLNGVQVSCTKDIKILADLDSILLNQKSFTIYKGQELPIHVTAKFNIEGNVILNKDDFQVVDFDNSKYDRDGKDYNVTYTSKGVTKNEVIKVVVLPNVTNFEIDTMAETVEGELVKFTAKVTYEDGTEIILTELNDNLKVIDYALDEVGEQTIIFKYKEGDIEKDIVKTIRVRAIIKVSLPLSLLFEINPNSGSFISTDIKINNMSKESVRVSVIEINPDVNNSIIDVLPSKYSSWEGLGVQDSNNIAIGLNCNDNWINKSITEPLYIVNANKSTELGTIDKMKEASIDIIAHYGTSQKEVKSFSYNIKWSIVLAEN